MWNNQLWTALVKHSIGNGYVSFPEFEVLAGIPSYRASTPVVKLMGICS